MIEPFLRSISPLTALRCQSYSSRESVMPAILRAENSELYALASRDAAKLAEARVRYPMLAQTHVGYDALLRDPGFAATMRPDASSTTSRRTTVFVCSVTFRCVRSGVQVWSGEYFAPTGQIGKQVSFRQQAPRPWYGCDVLADGWLHVAMSAASVHCLSTPRL